MYTKENRTENEFSIDVSVTSPEDGRSFFKKFCDVCSDSNKILISKTDNTRKNMLFHLNMHFSSYSLIFGR
jgi:hypothetical protein